MSAFHIAQCFHRERDALKSEMEGLMSKVTEAKKRECHIKEELDKVTKEVSIISVILLCVL